MKGRLLIAYFLLYMTMELDGRDIEEGKSFYHGNINVTVEEFTTQIYSDATVTDQEDTVFDPVAAALKALLETLHWKVGIGIHVYWPPVICCLGLIGNVLSLCVQLQPHNRAISCCVYMAGLAVCDCGMLGILLQYWARSVQVMYVDKVDLTTIVLPNWDCKMVTWLFQVLSLTGTFIMLSMTIDRFIGVRFPLHAMRICTVGQARRILACIPLVTACYCIPYILYTEQVGPSCVGLSVVTPFTRIYSWLTLSLNSFLPFVAIISMNMAIIVTILHSRKHLSLAKGLGEPTEKAKGKARDQQLIAQLLLVSFTFLILTLPLYIRYIVYLYVDTSVSIQSMATMQLTYHITNKLYYVNNACNFILYCIAGSKFRKDLKQVFWSCCRLFRRRGQDQSDKISSLYSMDSMKTSVSVVMKPTDEDAV